MASSSNRSNKDDDYDDDDDDDNSYTEQSPSWDADSYSVSQEISRPLRNPKIHYRIHKSPPLDSVLSHIYPVHSFPSYISEIIHFSVP